MSKDKTQAVTAPAVADPVDAYLASIGVAPKSFEALADEISVDYDEHHLTWTGETYERLRERFDFYRASSFNARRSVDAKIRQGWTELPADADVRLQGCHDGRTDVYMIRDKRYGQMEKQARKRLRDERAGRKPAIDGAPGRLRTSESTREDYAVYHRPQV